MREKRPEKPIPNVGDWILAIRENETVTLLVTDKDETSKRFQTRVFLSWIDATTPYLGRSATMKFETYRDHRYQPREAPINVHALPASITREQAQEALELEGWTPSTATDVLNDVGENGLIDATHLTDAERAILRAYIGEPAPAVTPPDGMPVTVAESPADVDTSPVVPVVLTPEEESDLFGPPSAQPTNADLMAEIKALRADIASLRGELRASKGAHPVTDEDVRREALLARRRYHDRGAFAGSSETSQLACWDEAVRPLVEGRASKANGKGSMEPLGEPCAVAHDVTW